MRRETATGMPGRCRAATFDARHPGPAANDDLRAVPPSRPDRILSLAWHAVALAASAGMGAAVACLACVSMLSP